MECDIFPSVLCHCWLGDRKGIWPVKTGCCFVGGDDLTGALHSYSSSCHHHFHHLGFNKMAVKMEREITGFTSDFLSFIVVELIRFFHGEALQFTDVDDYWFSFISPAELYEYTLSPPTCSPAGH